VLIGHYFAREDFEAGSSSIR